MKSTPFAEDYDSDGSLHEQYFSGYNDIGVHRLMLADAPRMSFFNNILSCESVVKNRIVVDVGSGTGILSMWAAKAGAKHVFSIEASSLSDIQSMVIKDNGLSDTITLLSEKVEDIINRGASNFISDYKDILNGCGVSLLVSEWMGFYLLHEGMLPSVIKARNFFEEINFLLGISKSIEMIPDKASIFLSPINCKPYYENRYKNFWGNLNGLDFSRYGIIEYETHLEQSAPLIDIIPSSCLIHEGVQLAEMDLLSISSDVVKSISHTVHFDFAHSNVFKEHLIKSSTSLEYPPRVVVDGFTLWFEVKFRDWVLNTSPHCESTHWKQTNILLPAEVREAAVVAFTSTEESLEVEVHLNASDESLRCYTIDIELK